MSGEKHAGPELFEKLCGPWPKGHHSCIIWAQVYGPTQGFRKKQSPHCMTSQCRAIAALWRCGVAASRPQGVAASWRRGVAASWWRGGGIMVSRHRCVAAFWCRGVAASPIQVTACSVAKSRRHGVSHSGDFFAFVLFLGPPGPCMCMGPTRSLLSALGSPFRIYLARALTANRNLTSRASQNHISCHGPRLPAGPHFTKMELRLGMSCVAAKPTTKNRHPRNAVK